LITGLGFTFQNTGHVGYVHKIVKLLYKLSLSRVDKVFFQNSDDEEFFRCSGILKKSTPSCVVNGSGVDLSSFEVVRLPAGAPVFLMIARLLGEKGVREYAQAAEVVKRRYPNVEFHLVGWIDDNPDSIKKCELDKWLECGCLKFLGRLDDVRPAIESASVFVLPSYREGTPRSVLESMAMGRPIITTDAPGCRETVVDGENGYLVPVGSVDGLVESIIKLIKNPALIPLMGKRSREIAENKYDVSIVNHVILNGMDLL
jgi:glycosyltransferase involved in cell wall biosynthesis